MIIYDYVWIYVCLKKLVFDLILLEQLNAKLADNKARISIREINIVY